MVRFSEWINKDNCVFYMSAQNDKTIRTYGSINGTFHMYDIVVDTNHTEDDKCLIKSKANITKGYIVLNDNLFKNISDKYTICFKMYYSGLDENVTVYPFSACIYDEEYNKYIYDKCRPIHEFRLEKNLFYYGTSHYTAGSIKRNALPQNTWVSVILTVDNSKTNQTRIRLYVNGKLMSLGYANNEDSSFDYDLWEMKRSLQYRWEFLGLSACNDYSMTEFAIFNDSFPYIESFIPPFKSLSSLMNLTNLTQRAVLIESSNTGFIDIRDIGKFVPDINLADTTSTRLLSKVSYIGDEWIDHIWTDLVSSLNELATEQVTIVNGCTSSQLVNALDSILTDEDIVVISIGYYDTDLDICLDNIKKIVDIVDKHHMICVICGYTLIYGNKADYLNKLNQHMIQYWYSSEAKFYYANTYTNSYTIYIKKEESYDEDNAHLNDKGILYYATVVSDSIKLIKDNEGKYPYKGFIDFKCSLSVPEFQSVYYDILSQMDIELEYIHITANDNIEIPIPYPYPEFKEDTPFILLTPDGKFIPEYYYTNTNDVIRFTNGNPYNVSLDESFRFLFVHKKGFASIQKIEKTYTSIVSNMTIDNPFSNIVALDFRVQVYYDGQLLTREYYEFNNRTNTITLKNLSGGNHTLSLVLFYTQSINTNRAIPLLPQSGYIEFDKNNIDRVWDKDLFAVFVNGELISKDKLLSLSNSTHKITEDIESRYNLDVVNMSPLVPYIVPMLQKEYNKGYAFDIRGRDLYSTMTVERASVYHPRYYVIENILNPLIDIKDTMYISLIHRSINDITYKLRFFINPYEEEAIKLRVVGQVRSYGNYEIYDEDKEDQLLISELPLELSNVDEDEVLCCVQVSDIYDNDSSIGDGVVLRLETYPQKTDRWTKLYYELETNNYEIRNEIEILEWVISTEENGGGQIVYRKRLGFMSYDTPLFEED